MRGLLRRYEFNAFVSQSPQVNPFEQRFPPAEQNRRDSNVQFINGALTKILLDCVRPPPPNGSEHVPPKNPGPNILKATGGEIIVNPGRTAVLAEQGPLERACWDQPLVQLRPANAERIVDVL